MSFFQANGVRKLNFDLKSNEIKNFQNAWKSYMKDVPKYPTDYFKGKGIVMCVGGVRYFTCAWIAIKHIRKIGCELPIEVWHSGTELSKPIIELLNNEGVLCRDFFDFHLDFLDGFMQKPFAILNSNFEDVLFIDSDNLILDNPEMLFELKEYHQYGAIFWPDFWETDPGNPIWEIMEVNYSKMKEQESGQLLINKRKSWNALNLAIFMNSKRSIFYNLLYGDKDTFRFSWLALDVPFYFIGKEPDPCGYLDIENSFMGTTMIQHDVHSSPLFLHRNLLKWDVTKSTEHTWTCYKQFKKNANQKEYELKYSELNSHMFINLKGDVAIIKTDNMLIRLEEYCLGVLEELRSRELFKDFLFYSYLKVNRFKGNSIAP